MKNQPCSDNTKSTRRSVLKKASFFTIPTIVSYSVSDLKASTPEDVERKFTDWQGTPM